MSRGAGRGGLGRRGPGAGGGRAPAAPGLRVTPRPRTETASWASAGASEGAGVPRALSRRPREPAGAVAVPGGCSGVGHRLDDEVGDVEDELLRGLAREDRERGRRRRDRDGVRPVPPWTAAAVRGGRSSGPTRGSAGSLSRVEAAGNGCTTDSCAMRGWTAGSAFLRRLRSRRAAWIAAPSATTSSGLMRTVGGRPKNCSTLRATIGIRVAPPTRITRSISLAFTPAVSRACRQTLNVRSTSASEAHSSSGRVIRKRHGVIEPRSPGTRSSIESVCSSREESSHFIRSARSRI